MTLPPDPEAGRDSSPDTPAPPPGTEGKGAGPPPEIARRFLAFGLRSAPRPAEVVAARLAASDGAAWLELAIERTLGVEQRALLREAPTEDEAARWLDLCRARADSEDAARRLDAAAAYFMVTAAVLARGETAEAAAAAGDLELALEELQPVAPESWRPVLAAAIRRMNG